MSGQIKSITTVTPWSVPRAPFPSLPRLPVRPAAAAATASQYLRTAHLMAESCPGAARRAATARAAYGSCPSPATTFTVVVLAAAAAVAAAAAWACRALSTHSTYMSF